MSAQSVKPCTFKQTRLKPPAPIPREFVYLYMLGRSATANANIRISYQSAAPDKNSFELTFYIFVGEREPEEHTIYLPQGLQSGDIVFHCSNRIDLRIKPVDVNGSHLTLQSF